MDNIIKRLSAKAVNKIAAGEVIVSPVNVVKELIENSIDALSSRIDIVLEHGGRNLIRITDNGSGISKDDLPLVIERYATSKLPEEDLVDIKYMGFRGEAMHSIATVSRLSIVSKHVNSNCAWNLCTEGGEKSMILPAKLISGTTVTVQDLFFSTPNRIKFLRSEKTELGHIIDILNKFALVHPQISFSLIADEKKLIEYKNCRDFYERIFEMKTLGKDLVNNICYGEFEEGNYKIILFASRPTANSTQSNFYIFINNRPVHDLAISSAIKSAYFDYIPKNRFPTVIIFLSLPTSEVDVNVHPTKNEVRILNLTQIKKFVFSSITKAIAKDNVLQLEEGSASVLKKNVEWHDVGKNTTKDALNLSDKVFAGYNYFFNKNDVNGFDPHGKPFNFNQTKTEAIQNITMQKPLISEKEYLVKCQLYETYIVIERANEIIVVDQHAAHERLLYEKFKKNLNKESQILLVSEVIELSMSEIYILEENQALLDAVGLGIERFGKNFIVIQKIPIILKGFDLKVLVKDLLADGFLPEKSLTQKMERVYAHIACKNAIKANTKLSNEEMHMIVDGIETTDFSAQCNHGRPTYIKVEKIEIEKKFERK